MTSPSPLYEEVKAALDAMTQGEWKNPSPACIEARGTWLGETLDAEDAASIVKIRNLLHSFLAEVEEKDRKLENCEDIIEEVRRYEAATPSKTLHAILDVYDTMKGVIEGKRGVSEDLVTTCICGKTV